MFCIIALNKEAERLHTPLIQLGNATGRQLPMPTIPMGNLFSLHKELPDLQRTLFRNTHGQ